MITENVSTLKIHKLTQEQYNRELEAGRIDENALYLTPDEDVDLSGYATVEQLNGKADSVHSHAISDVDNLQNTLNENLSSANAYAEELHADKDIFWAEYGVTTSEEISEAYDAGKQILLKINDISHKHFSNLIEIIETEFVGSMVEKPVDNMFRFHIHAQNYNLNICAICDNSEWSYTTHEIKDDNLYNYVSNLHNNVTSLQEDVARIDMKIQTGICENIDTTVETGLYAINGVNCWGNFPTATSGYEDGRYGVMIVIKRYSTSAHQLLIGQKGAYIRKIDIINNGEGYTLGSWINLN